MINFLNCREIRLCTGTSLEVSSVCSIMSALGLVESATLSSVNEESNSALDGDASSNRELSVRSLYDMIKVKFDATPFESFNRGESIFENKTTDIDHQDDTNITDDPQTSQLFRDSLGDHDGDKPEISHRTFSHLSTNTASAVPAETTVEDDLDMDIVDILIGGSVDDCGGLQQCVPVDAGEGGRASVFGHLEERSLSLPSEQALLGALDMNVSIDQSGSLQDDDIMNLDDHGLVSDNQNSLGGEFPISGMSVTKEVTGSSSGTGLSRRQSQSSSKVWKLRNSEEFPNQLVSLILQASQRFQQWTQSCNSHAIGLDVEERILRFVASQCDIPFPAKPFRTSTKYMEINHNSDDMSQTVESVVNRKEEPIISRRASSRRELFEPFRNFTADALIEKVEKNRRQRGQSLQLNASNIPQFSSSHLLTLKVACRKTQSSFRLIGEGNGIYESLPKAKRQKLVQSEQMSLAEYLRSGLSQGLVINNTSPSPLSAMPNITLAGSFPIVNSTTMKKYASSHQLWMEHINEHITVGVPIYEEGKLMDRPIYLPDIAVSTLEVPWHTLVPEFTLVTIDDAGEFVDGLSNVLLSHAEQSLDPLNSFHAAVSDQQSPYPNRLHKKRSRSIGKGPDDHHDYSASIHHTLKRKIISDVYAPAFRIVETVSYFLLRVYRRDVILMLYLTVGVHTLFCWRRG